ncbi:MAG: phage portal protein [Oscillospiraceae bacterium]
MRKIGLFEWLSKRLGGEVPINAASAYGDELNQLYTEACYRDMALWTAIDIIAKAVSKCEIKEYSAGIEIRGDNWYKWNVEPNLNENSSTFWRKVVGKILTEGECLVVEQSGQLLAADSFQRTEYALYDDLFSGITVKDFTFQKTFSGRDVLYWNINYLGNARSIKNVVSAVSMAYAKVLDFTIKSHQSARGTKALLKYDTIPPNLNQEEKNKWLQGQVKKYAAFINADNAVATLGKGLELDPFAAKTTYSNETTRDIRALIDDISDFTAKSLGIPPALLRGDVQGISDVTDQLLTFSVDPFTDLLREEMLRKIKGKPAVLKGDDIVFDTRQIKHADIIGAATNIEKLISSAAYSVNEVRMILGEKPILESWADEHFMTKNIATMDEVMNPVTESAKNQTQMGSQKGGESV